MPPALHYITKGEQAMRIVFLEEKRVLEMEDETARALIRVMSDTKTRHAVLGGMQNTLDDGEHGFSMRAHQGGCVISNVHDPVSDQADIAFQYSMDRIHKELEEQGRPTTTYEAMTEYWIQTEGFREDGWTEERVRTRVKVPAFAKAVIKRLREEANA